MNRINKIIIAAIIIFVIVIAAIFLYFLNPEEVSIFPRCPFLLTTGYKCPGCGIQRALHDILHFRFLDAIRHNIFIVFAIPYILTGVYVEYFGGKYKYPKLNKILFGGWSAVVVIFVVVVYWIGRNFM